MKGDPCLEEWSNVNCDGDGNIEDLDLTDQGLHGTIPPWIGGLTSLTDNFNLDQNTITGALPTELGMLTSITAGLLLG